MTYQTKNKIKIAIALITPILTLFIHRAHSVIEAQDNIVILIAIMALPGAVALFLLRRSPLKKDGGGIFARMLGKLLLVFIYLSMYLPFVLYFYITLSCGDFDLECLML